MKATVKIETEIEVKYIGMSLAVRYGEEDIPNDFPGRQGDTSPEAAPAGGKQ